MRSPLPWRRSAPRAQRGKLVALLIALFLGATTSDLAHRVTVDHAVCDEHGELVHVAAVSVVTACGVADLAHPSDEGPHARPLEREGRLHEHCQIGPLVRERATPIAHGLDGAGSAPPPRPGTSVLPLVAPARAEPLLLLAPKQSPPV